MNNIKRKHHGINPLKTATVSYCCLKDYLIEFAKLFILYFILLEPILISLYHYIIILPFIKAYQLCNLFKFWVYYKQINLKASFLSYNIYYFLLEAYYLFVAPICH